MGSEWNAFMGTYVNLWTNKEVHTVRVFFPSLQLLPITESSNGTNTEF